jgi:hypothetical protein
MQLYQNNSPNYFSYFLFIPVLTLEKEMTPECHFWFILIIFTP